MKISPAKVIARVKQALIGMSGLSAKLHRVRGYHKITIVSYHGIHSDELPLEDHCFMHLDRFKEQMHYLHQHFNVLPLEQALQIADYDGEKPLAAITFDDGFYNNYSLAFPVLKALQLPATVFLATNYINSHHTIWFCDLLRMLSQTPKNSLLWQGKRYPLKNNEQKQAVSRLLQAQLKTRKTDEARAELQALAKALDCDLNYRYQADSPFYMLTAPAIKEMSDSGLITFGAHTHNHVILSKTTLEHAREEIQTSILETEKLTGKPCYSFAYPNGRAEDFNESHQQMLSDNGIRFSATTINGLTAPQKELLAFKRLFINTDTGIEVFKLQVHGHR
ncbi:polysaccharide deacetylase family protein [Thalassomonas actiniarum]|uniref:Polysaccharide deacetylase family protein n=1 Tax=Thalassomonas actiniarum TaxID=485447 RepID=A0AAE9YR03_9GAMM|nr:polysaccharide deacetylase family protein [Thalassomonas actiniarum]WDD99480.1 polysaccharide deacetylase family protein [Thalassomonas actiniarum]